MSETPTALQTRTEVDPSPSQSRTKLITFYLPQFYPTKENDEWWGKGFTEWTNVTKTRPRFRGHYQPHLPADLGFYDLRLPEAREAQAELAKDHGIYGFCYYHYWFHGRRILERPFGEVLATGKPDFPFCLCWANDSWNRTWEEASHSVLVEQTYSHEDNLTHIRWLLRAFEDRRYIRIEGKPLFLVYRAQNLPTSLRTAETWRAEARRAGIGDIFLCTVLSNMRGSRIDPTSVGFDAAVEFQPSVFRPRPVAQKVWERLWRGPSNNRLLEYSEIMGRALQAEEPPYRWFRCVTPSFDNTARRKTRALILKGSHPEKYREWLKAVIAKSRPTATGDRVVFVNAWNEWAEGNHLEPCQQWGRAFLEATREAIHAADFEVSDATSRTHTNGRRAVLQESEDREL